MAQAADVRASWNISLPEGEFLVEFEHGTTSGRRLLRIDGKEMIRREWMFRLVGPESFSLGRFDCVLQVEPDGLLGISYTLEINGQNIKDFLEMYQKSFCTWSTQVNHEQHRIVLEKETMNVWVDGKSVDVQVQFVEGGAGMTFSVDGIPVSIRSRVSGNKKQGMMYHLFIENGIVRGDSSTSLDRQCIDPRN